MHFVARSRLIHGAGGVAYDLLRAVGGATAQPVAAPGVGHEFHERGRCMACVHSCAALDATDMSCSNQA